MPELKLPRLLAAAKEFNVGQDTIIDFLVGKGFSHDDLKPTSKLTEAMYRSLQQKFQSDKVAKLKSDQIDLPKGTTETKKKKEEEAIVFKKEAKPAEEKATKEKKETKKKEEPAKVKVEAPELEGPKVVDKIDLSAVDSSTRPKKGAKKKAEEEPKEKPAKGKKKTAAAEEAPAPPEVEEPAQPAEEAPPVIENIKADKLEGPKILGKIELPVAGDAAAKDEKRKRKRIPIEKKEVQRPGEILKRKDQEGMRRDDRSFKGGRVSREHSPETHRAAGASQPNPRRTGRASTSQSRTSAVTPRRHPSAAPTADAGISPEFSTFLV